MAFVCACECAKSIVLACLPPSFLPSFLQNMKATVFLSDKMNVNNGKGLRERERERVSWLTSALRNSVSGRE